MLSIAFLGWCSEILIDRRLKSAMPNGKLYSFAYSYMRYSYKPSISLQRSQSIFYLQFAYLSMPRDLNCP